MPRDKTLSHRKIMQSAMEEFSEYGYEKASMRRIGGRCGLTAAALYRHYDNKEAMFDSLVRPAVEDLRAWIDEHVSMWESAEIDMMRELIYPRMDEYALLINKSHGFAYVQATAFGLRCRDGVMGSITAVREGCEDIYAEAVEANEEKACKAEDKAEVIEDKSAEGKSAKKAAKKAEK